MKSNPAYHVMIKYKHEFNPEHHNDVNKNNYFLVPLPVNETSLKIGNQTYRPQNKTHFSIYEKFDKKTSVLSAFHVTWYGHRELSNLKLSNNNNERTKQVVEIQKQQAIEVHIYFDEIGRVIFCLATDQDSKKSIPIDPVEEVQLRRYGRKVAATVLEKILLFVTNECQKKSTEVSQLFSQLETISRVIKTQYKKYITVAECCIQAIREKNIWTFGDKDPRETMLANTLSAIEMQFTSNEESATKKGPQFYQPAIENVSSEEKTVVEPEITKETSVFEKKRQLTKSEQEEQELSKKVDTIGREIIQLDKKKKFSDLEKELKKRELLQKQFALVSNSLNILAIEKMLMIFGDLHQNNLALNDLFKKKAKEGDIEAVKSLASFIDWIDPLFFAQLIGIGNIQVCEFLLQTFRECVYYLNYTAAGNSKRWDIQSVKSSMKSAESNAVTLFRFAYIKHQNFDFIKMLLENGADPNFISAVSSISTISLLILVLSDSRLSLDNRRKFVELLLRYGADPNLPKEVMHSIVTSVNDNKIIRKTKSMLVQGKKDFTTDPIKETPLFIATVMLKNFELVELLLKYGASITEYVDGYDAMGMATCERSEKPNLNIVKLLVQQGADINAEQGNAGEKVTPLIYACQRPEDLTTVEGLVELGADPNRTVSAFITTDSGIEMISMNPLLKSAHKGHTKVVQYLLQQKDCPLTFATIAETCSLYFSIMSPKNIVIAASEEGINILFIDLERKPNEIASLLAKASTQEFSLEEREKCIKMAIEKANKYFNQQKYVLAIQYFHIPLLFGNDEQRLTACYNLGSSYRKTGEIGQAKEMYQICIAFKPNSSTGQNAQKVVDILNKQNTLTMKL